MDMGSATVENVTLVAKIGAAVLSFVANMAPLVAQLFT